MNENYVSDGKDITFGDLSWPKEFETTFNASSPGSKPYYYTLDTVLQYLKDPFEPHDAYCQRAKNFGVVRPIHKKALYDYLTGGKYLLEFERIDNEMNVAHKNLFPL